MGSFPPKLGKVYFFYQPFQQLYYFRQRETENLEFVQGVNFDFFDLLQNNSSKYLLHFGDSNEETCKSKSFVGSSTAGRH